MRKVLVIGVVLALVGCGESGDGGTGAGAVSRVEFGERWPLTVDRGTVRCEGSQLVFTAPDGTDYALNGTAQDQGNYPPIDPIWRYQPGLEKYELRVNIGPLMDRARKSC